VLQESIRRRAFTVVVVLTLAFVALFTLATVEAFARLNTLNPGRGTLDSAGLATITLVGLGMFATLFLATVLAVFLTLGAVRGDAERGLLQPLVVRPLGRAELLLGRFAGAAIVCVGVRDPPICGRGRDRPPSRWPLAGPDRRPRARARRGLTILVALSLLGSVFLSTIANGIAMFMLYGAALVAGLLATIAAALGSDTVQTIAHDLSIALPFEALYQAGLHALGANQRGFAGVLLNLGPFGSSRAGSVWLDLWSAFYLGVLAAIATVGFAHRDL
jgi:hypothetical protein